LPVTRLLLGPDDRVSDNDLSYLAALLPPPGCITGVVPLIYRYQISEKGRVSKLAPEDQERYLDFVRRYMAIAGPSYSRDLQMAVPPNFTNRQTIALLAEFRDHGGPLAVIDAFGTTTRDRYPQLRAVLGVGSSKSFGLRGRFGNDYAVYAFDSKAYVAHSPKAPATNLLQLLGGYSGFGPLRTSRTVIVQRPDAPRPKPKPPRVLVKEDLCYVRSSVPGSTADIRAWAESHGIKDDRPERDLDTRRRYTAEAVAAAAKQMVEWSRREVLSKEIDRRKDLDDEVKRVRRTNRRELFGSQTTLGSGF
jgi:hypothetical protein